MGENSKIEWTDHTFNPWIGCTKVHQGCAHCYAETLMDDRYGKVAWGPNGTRVMTSDKNWSLPIKWNAQAERDGVRRRVFCASLADVFEDWTGKILGPKGWPVHRGQPWHLDQDLVEIKDVHVGQSLATMHDLRKRLFALIDATPWLDWLLLTKRPENIRRMWVSRVELQTDLDEIDHRSNVWLGTSVVDQASADKQIPDLEACRDLSPVTFLSVEPLLGPIDLDFACVRRELSCIDWVIVGGESGSKARPMHWRWAWALRDQCVSADVPFFFKQWGEWQSGLKSPMDYAEGAKQFKPGVYHDFGDDSMALRTGKRDAGRLLDGREWNEFPISQETNHVTNSHG